jgi:hypothetical protein
MGASCIPMVSEIGPRPLARTWCSCIARILTALVTGFGLVTGEAGNRAAASESIGTAELRVVVTERPGVVRLRVLLPEDVPAGSVEVQVTGRRIVVLAQDVAGRQRRSRSLRSAQAVVEDGAEADYEPDGSLIIRLRGVDGP